MKISNSSLIIVLNTIVLIVLIEFSSYGILKVYGIDSPLFIIRGTTVKEMDSDRFNTLDPHLGYSYDNTADKVKELGDEFHWVDGFVVYEKEKENLRHPIILALGGSTTDGVNYGHSWPEELSKILKQKGFTGTVINGGIGGYSTNQELLKLVRDGLEFNPDLVISYSGINDRGKYSILPYPMVHRYQKKLFETLVKQSQSKFMPSTITLINRLTDNKSATKLSFTFGIKTKRSLAEQYEKNIKLMNTISKSQGAKFIAFIQPFAFYKSTHGEDPKISKGDGYKNQVIDLYNRIILLPKALPFIHDATQILENDSDVYKKDAVHLTRKGDEIVANHIYSQIEPILSEINNEVNSRVQ